MDWRLKAAIQNALGILPSSLSHAAYYWLQRRYGALRRINPRSQILAAVRIAKAIASHGGSVSGSVVMEVGTGRRLNLPLTMWVLGADQVITLDLNRYLKCELIEEDLRYLRENSSEFEELLEGLDFRKDRLGRLLDFDVASQGLGELLELAEIQYAAPADAARLDLGVNSVDYHVSSNVFEHIPRKALVKILTEGARVMHGQGLFVHCIDHSDHFSHVDRSLSAVNFLRYNDRQWGRLAGNRYMYMNRLQSDDFRNIFRESGHEVLTVEASPDVEVLEDLRSSSVPLDDQFADKPLETLAILSSMFVSRPNAITRSNTCEAAA